MPGTYAHLMITEKALEQFLGYQAIGEKLRGSVLAYSHLTHLGSVGPDYPYLDLIQPKQKHWADHMHYRHTGDAVKTMAQRLLTLGDQALREKKFIIPFCWTLGYISHVTGDLVIHPVVMNVVGPYEENEREHRHCEMIQDAVIYHRIRNGAEIEHSGLMRILQLCSQPGDKDRIHPSLRSFWRRILNTHFPEECRSNYPDIDEWHDQFEDMINLAGTPVFIGPILDPGHQYTYKKTDEITTEERNSFIDRLPLPGNKIGTYEDLFQKAVSQVSAHWLLLSKGISTGNIDPFLSAITNCDLDTGKDLQTGDLAYWQ
jgi:hypothetical protein